MPSFSIRISDEMRVSKWIDTASEKVAVSAKKRLVELLAKKELDGPKQFPPQLSTTANIWVSDNDTKRLQAMGSREELSVGETISNLLTAHFLEWKKNQEKPVAAARTFDSATSRLLAQAMTGQKKVIRQEQGMLTEVLDSFTHQAHTSPMVLMAEAGTGVGKTSAYLAAVYEFLMRQPKSVAFIAVPTFALANQVLGEWESIKKALDTDIKTMALIGQGEFVSESALMEFIQAQEEKTGEFPEIVKDQIDQIKKWVNESSPYPVGALIRHHWTVDGLMDACPKFDQAKAVSLVERSTDDDAGYYAYKRQWSDIPYTRLVICTHAMLANLTKRRFIAQSRALKNDEGLTEAIREWKAMPPDDRKINRLYEITNAIYADRNVNDGLDLLPNIDFLVVDEGHALEDAFAAALSRDVSLNSLLKDAIRLSKDHPGLFLSTGDLVQQVSIAKAIHEASPDNIRPLDCGKDSYFEALTQAIEQCITPKSSAGKNKLAKARSSSTYRTLNYIAQAFRSTIEFGNSLSNGQANSAALMHWSPERGFPRVHVGRTSCARELNYLWTNVSGKAIVVSGTLYESNPALTCEAIRRSLAVPSENLVTMQPIHAQWQIDPVTLCMISVTHHPDGRIRFCRPSRDKKGQMDKAARMTWLQDVARYTIDAHKSAAGGVLVLATAFDDIRDFTALLYPYINEPIMSHAPGVTLKSLRLSFLEAVRNGKRPVLIAAGGAWTGFDIFDPAYPDALTDLVILNAPFGVIKRTVSRMLRAASKTGHFEISSQALLLVRQAVGRLIRSPDTPPNRRIHWLDARIHSAALGGMLSSTKRFLGRYKQRVVS